MPKMEQIARVDLERLTSAATAFVALQAMTRREGGPALPAIQLTIDGRHVRLDPKDQLREHAELEQAVIRTRQRLGWR